MPRWRNGIRGGLKTLSLRVRLPFSAPLDTYTEPQYAQTVKPESRRLFRWSPGRQDSGYSKMLLFEGCRCDAYLLKYPVGSHVAPHRDPVAGSRHFRLNLILRSAEGGEFWAEQMILNWSRLKLFRPDKVEHGVRPITRGTRWVLSIGWVLKDHEVVGKLDKPSDFQSEDVRVRAPSTSLSEATGEVVVRGLTGERSFGWGPFRNEWFSFCSIHFELTPDCTACHSGYYVNCWWNVVDRMFYAVAPGIWRWWANLETDWWWKITNITFGGSARKQPVLTAERKQPSSTFILATSVAEMTINGGVTQTARGLAVTQFNSGFDSHTPPFTL